MLEEIPTDLLLADFGVPVVTPFATGTGILDQNSELVLEGQLVMVDYVLTAPSTLLGQLDYGDLVTVAGRQFSLTHAGLRYSDGVWTSVPVQPTDAGNLPVPPYGRQVILDGNLD